VMDLGILENMEKVHMWRGHLRARESVRKAVTFDYSDRLLAFVRGRGSYMSKKISHWAR
jgi:glutathione S-transferase